MFLGHFAAACTQLAQQVRRTPHGPMRDAVLPVEDVWDTVLTMGFRSLHRVKIRSL
jgi:hypothetical protein